MLSLNCHVIEYPLFGDALGYVLMLVVGCRMREGVELVEMVEWREGERGEMKEERKMGCLIAMP